MLIAHEKGKEIHPGVFVWKDEDEYLSLDDGKRWPTYVSIEEPEEGNERISRFYEIQGLVHPQDREESNKMKMSRIFYLLIKEDHWQGKEFQGSLEPTPREAMSMRKGKLTRAQIEPYLVEVA